MDLTFLIDREKAIQLRNQVIDELESWNNILSAEDESNYYKIIAMLNNIIENLK